MLLLCAFSNICFLKFFYTKILGCLHEQPYHRMFELKEKATHTHTHTTVSMSAGWCWEGQNYCNIILPVFQKAGPKSRPASECLPWFQNGSIKSQHSRRSLFKRAQEESPAGPRKRGPSTQECPETTYLKDLDPVIERDELIKHTDLWYE